PIYHCPTLLYFYGFADPRDLPSFPTRRSSDLVETHNGRIVAQQVGLFVNAYTTGLHDVIDRAIVPVESIVLATEPLPPALCQQRSEEHTSELQSRENLVCRLLLEKKKRTKICQ